MTTSARLQLTRHRLSLPKALLLALPMVLLSAMMLTQGQLPADPLWRIGLGVTFIFFNTLFVLMLYTGRTDVYRAIFFIVIAVGFIIFFITNLIEVRGSMILQPEDMISGKTPFCHLAIPSIIVPAALTRTIIFPGSLATGFANVFSMVILWVGASLALGRGWCSWGCFYGGLDEGFSRLAKKPRLKDIDRRWTYLPYAVLGGVMLVSALTLSPAYCEWLCPFKAVTEFPAVTSFKLGVQTAIFISLFIGLVIVLPILSKRRIQCALFCPLGALQALANKLSIFEVRIDREKCVDCKRCISLCPTFSLDEASVQQGCTLLSCTRCGKCMDHCPKGAISYHIKGTKLGVSAGKARVLFLYPAYLLGTTLSGGMLAGAIWRLLKLVTTGSMF